MANSTQPDTIIAPASALGGGVAVVRVSGPLAGHVFQILVGSEVPPPRQAQLVTLRHNDKILDRALALYFVAPHSFTGEDVLELHVHGGRAVVSRVINAALAVDPHIRMAQGGEFTKRAYLNGKMDLTEAEAIADLVAAETEAQAEQALAQMGGRLRDLYEAWRAEIVRMMAYMEASIDFSDENGVPADVAADMDAKIAKLISALDAHIDDGNVGERLRDGFTVAVIGAPNAGKSSLVNALVRRDVAIVSDIAGTTRDMIEAHVNMGGYPVILVDTAGLRDTQDTIESEGIKRARQRAANADIVLALFDGTCAPDADTHAAINDKTIIVKTKADAVQKQGDGFTVSAKTGQNIDALVAQIVARIVTLAAPKNATPPMTRARHRTHVTEAQGHLHRARTASETELKAENMRLAARALGRITGRVDVEDVLDIIFRDFCIGK
jgi:tRNA modification GTPase